MIDVYNLDKSSKERHDYLVKLQREVDELKERLSQERLEIQRLFFSLEDRGAAIIENNGKRLKIVVEQRTGDENG